MSAALVDTHCHLDLAEYDADRDEVIQRAVDQGVTRIVVPAVDIDSVARVVALADRYTNVFAAVGIHPNDIPTGIAMAEVRARLRDAAVHPRVVAIGEIGLDYHWQTTPHDIQHEWLRMQLDLASELELPVILHNREATRDTVDVACRWAAYNLPESLAGRPGVLHSISAGWADAETVLQHGFYVGFTGPLTYKSADEMRDVAARAPSDHILVETDGPFLSPHPHRGERNEPAFVTSTAERLSHVRSTSFEQTCNETTANACRLFGWPHDEHPG